MWKDYLCITVPYQTQVKRSNCYLYMLYDAHFWTYIWQTLCVWVTDQVTHINVGWNTWQNRVAYMHCVHIVLCVPWGLICYSGYMVRFLCHVFFRVCMCPCTRLCWAVSVWARAKQEPEALIVPLPRAAHFLGLAGPLYFGRPWGVRER